MYAAMAANRHLKILKSDCERMKTGFAYAVCASNGKTFIQFTLDMNAPLYHHFNDHQFCGVWCKYREEPATEEDREKRRKRFRIKPSALFDCIQKVYERFVTPDMLRQVFHTFSTQKNESLNKEIATVAPKDKTFSLTKSLSDRVDFVVVRGTIGNLATVQEVCDQLGMQVPTMTEEFLRREDRRRSYIGSYFKKPAVKRGRANKKKMSMRAQLAKEVEDDKLGFTYQAGVAVLGGGNVTGNSAMVVEGGGDVSAAAVGSTCKCGATTHQRVTHRACPLNKKNCE